VGLLEKHVGAETFGGDDLAVVEVMAVEVGVVPQVGRLPDPAAAVAIHLGETAVLGAVREIVAQVPLAEVAGGVAGVLEHLGEGDFVFAQHRAAVDRVPDAGAVGPMPGEQCRPRGRAGWRDVIVGQLR
jgi:hypothetical protein